jgi:hypothetical protein
MKRFWTGHRTREAADSPQRSHLRVEALEAREMPANHLLIDFTPDAVPNERWQPATFAAAFTLRYANGTAPAFLDFNRDGYVSSADVGPGALAVANRVAIFLQPFDVKVWYGDVQSNTDMGRQWLSWGQQSASEQVFVMYTGGIRQNGNTTIIGEAYQPAVGYVNEYYAYTYMTSITRYFMNTWPGATSSQFVDKVAQTIVHEFGHLVGLGHVYGNPVGDPSVMNYNSNASTAYIPDAGYPNIQLYDNNRKEYWGWQNPAQEMRASLRGEPNYSNYFRGLYSQSVAPGLQLETVGELLGDGHGGPTHGGGHYGHDRDTGDPLMPAEHERGGAEGQPTTLDDVDILAPIPAETGFTTDHEQRDVSATGPKAVLDSIVLMPAPELAPKSASGRITSMPDRNFLRGRHDSLDWVGTTPHGT